MRFCILPSLLALGLATGLDARPCQGAESPPTIAVGVNGIVNIRLWGPAKTVILANPAVADVHVANGRSLIITGHRVGQTSLMVLDSAGRETLHQTIVVGPSDTGHVAIQRGVDEADYVCSARCEPAKDPATSASPRLAAGSHDAVP